MKRSVSVRVQQCNFGDDRDKWLRQRKRLWPRGERLAILSQIVPPFTCEKRGWKQVKREVERTTLSLRSFSSPWISLEIRNVKLPTILSLLPGNRMDLIKRLYT